jgi:hypothetical protein
MKMYGVIARNEILSLALACGDIAEARKLPANATPIAFWVHSSELLLPNILAPFGMDHFRAT